MRLTVKKQKHSTKTVLQCPNCGYQVRRKPPKEGETVIRKPAEKLTPREAVIVISQREASLKTSSTQKVECPKCGHREAYVWMVQTRGADESSTQFFRCTKCGYTWREYS